MALPTNNSFIFPQGLSGDVLSVPINQIVIWNTGYALNYTKFSVSLRFATPIRGFQYLQIAVSRNDDLAQPKLYGNYLQNNLPGLSSVIFRPTTTIYSTYSAFDLHTVNLFYPVTLQRIIMSMHNGIPGYRFSPLASNCNYDWVYQLIGCLVNDRIFSADTLHVFSEAVRKLRNDNDTARSNIPWPAVPGTIIRHMF